MAQSATGAFFGRAELSRVHGSASSLVLLHKSYKTNPNSHGNILFPEETILLSGGNDLASRRKRSCFPEETLLIPQGLKEIE